MKFVLMVMSLFLVSCSIPRLAANDFPFAKGAKAQCMELAEITCGKAETCNDKVDWNMCMYATFERTCIHVGMIGPGYLECYKSIVDMQCTDKVDESCSRAFLRGPEK